MSKRVSLLLNSPLSGFPAGTIIKLWADDQGTILSSYWRRRMRDAIADNCVELAEEATTEEPAQETPELSQVGESNKGRKKKK